MAGAGYEVLGIFRALGYAAEGGCLRRRIDGETNASVSEIRDAATGGAPTAETVLFDTLTINPHSAGDRPTDHVLEKAGLADTVALSVATVSSLVHLDGDQVEDAWMFSDAEDTMAIHNPFADIQYDDSLADLSAGEDRWVYRNPSETYGVRYEQWRDATLARVVAGEAPSLSPKEIPSP